MIPVIIYYRILNKGVVHIAHIKALAIKIGLYIVFGFIILGIIFVAPLGQALLAAVLVAIINYLMGDLVILRNSGNGPALIVDAITAFAFTWVYLNIMAEGDFLVAGFVFAVAVGIFEWFFHGWLLNNVLSDNRSTN